MWADRIVSALEILAVVDMLKSLERLYSHLGWSTLKVSAILLQEFPEFISFYYGKGTNAT